MQNSKFKIQNCNPKLKVIKLINFSFLFVIFNFALLTLNLGQIHAQNVSYPISQLGNCRDGKECKLYCDIPQNTPACWSYDKYVINQNILGEETVNITYPINELGSCQSAEKCFLYCAQPQNQAACLDYAKKNGLVKETDDSSDEPPSPEVLTAAAQELGCSSRDTCMAICNDQNNFEKCHNFAEKHKLRKPSDNESSGPPPQVMLRAKSELGCMNETSCMNFCNNPENSEICFEFAKKHELLAKEEIEKHDEYLQKREELMTEAKKELGCDSPQSCQAFCQNKENLSKCASLTSKIGAPPSQNNMQNAGSGGEGISNPISGQLGPGGCATETECKAYCTKNPNDCKGFTQNYAQNSQLPSTSGNLNPNNPPNIPGNNPPTQKSGIGNSNSKEGDYLGPGGCKTEKECKAYCEKHPGDCPGFPKDQKAQTTSSPSAKTAPVTPVQTGSKKGQKTETSRQNIKPVSNSFPPPNGPNSPNMNNDNPPLPLLTLPPLEP